jgi:hypothetical protein
MKFGLPTSYCYQLTMITFTHNRSTKQVYYDPSSYHLIHSILTENGYRNIILQPPTSQPRFDTLPDDLLRLIAKSQFDIVIYELTYMIQIFTDEIEDMIAEERYDWYRN